MNQTAGSQTTQLDFMSNIRLRFGLVLVGFYSLMSLIIVVISFTRLDIEVGFSTWAQVVSLLVSLVLLITLIQRRYILIIMNILALATAIYAHFVPTDQLFLAIGFMAIIIAAMLSSWYIHALNIGIFVIGMGTTLVEDHHDATTEDIASIFAITLVVIVISTLVRYVSASVQRVAATSQRNTVLLQATAEVGQTTSHLLEQTELLNNTVNMIRDRFGYYHVQIFLIDEENTNAHLVASTGHVGDVLLERGHKLAVGSQSVIGRVTQLGESIIARQADSDGVHARNELLPDTQSELALPITDGERIIGALDVQSVQANAFDNTDIRALQVMTNQIAVAIRNARLFEEQANNLRENKRLFLESEANLREIQRLNSQLTRKVWSDYLDKKREDPSILLDEKGDESEAPWTKEMIEAGKRRRTVVSQGDKQTIAVPIVLRGEVIGAIEVEPGKEARTDDTTEMVRAIAGHLAVSLDNARLFEEAQESTLQEQRINEIVTRYQAAGTVDDLLQITLQELGSTLGAQQSMIRLSSSKRQNGLPAPVPKAHEEDIAQQNGGRQS